MSDTLKNFFIAAGFFFVGILLAKAFDTLGRTNYLPAQKVQSENFESLNSTIKELKALIAEQQRQQESAQNSIQQLIATLQAGDTNNSYTSELPSNPNHINASYEAEVPEEDYRSAAALIDNQLYAGSWSRQDAMQLMQMSNTMSHRQRTQLQTKIVNAINEGMLTPEDLTIPLF